MAAGAAAALLAGVIASCGGSGSAAAGEGAVMSGRISGSTESLPLLHELLRLVQLEGFIDRYPSQLSGGQRQRMALARAPAVEPRVLLLDEPFGALDARVRTELRQWLRRLHEKVHVTTVFVTHDQEEAMDVADQIVVMNDGGIEQVGPPTELYHHPATEFVMSFVGSANGSGRCSSARTTSRSGNGAASSNEHPVAPDAAPLAAHHQTSRAGDGTSTSPVCRAPLGRGPAGAVASGAPVNRPAGV